ncbi:glucosaminidase domain-containing protein [Dethiobacter alkaliphilus]|uniref:Mannosyl-glycoprotein endo-beta-N-acetylglucosaminidase n=1 Tax=Dethiobacter alkaliphilus AHT 1 TaxID=555088 RepID=C0GIC8_DETAL|nr:glucosaminidase domain-containing protein [Dethiobacter alkaliphilus]EEG76976.1 Mannosyl-glycoprotein endo-beta-N-acetylglucosaminidase [Dethiobacter alkaliphilus AHT 1]
MVRGIFPTGWLKVFFSAFLVLLLLTSHVSAAIIGFVAEGSDGKYYEYDYDDLLESYVMNMLGSDAKLFNDFRKKSLTAYLDDVNGYVDYEDVLEAYALSIITGKKFDVNAYTAGGNARLASMPNSVIVVTEESGKLVFTEKALDALENVLERINKASTVDEMRVALLERSSALGINLAAYNNLNSYGKTAAINEVLRKRPEDGYGSAKQIKDTFDNAVSAARAQLDAAVKAVNDASDTSKMRKALTDNDKVLELKLDRYSLSSSEADNLAGNLLGERPFASAGELRYILHTHILGKRFGAEVTHTRYPITLKEALDIQMALTNPRPQTDLYGGGWQNAKRDDVEYHLNPYNFIDLDYTGGNTEEIRITASSLRVRERPTTNSPQLKTDAGANIAVTNGQVFTILAAAEAEPDTAAGTEGTWYKISVQGKEGWVCGAYVTNSTSALSSSIFQFLVLTGNAGTTEEVLNNILSGRGTLHNQGAAFLQGSKEHNINEVFLVSLALHETGNGTSKLATGIEVEDVDNKVEGKNVVKVYNMFGIGARDSNPNHLGAQRAYQEGWFSPEEAIKGGAAFAARSYISRNQDTLYKMRWNPANPGTYQYASDIGWAAKQVGRYNQIGNYNLKFDIPRYKQ